MEALINILRFFFTPIMPRHWRTAASVLSHSVGWEPPGMTIGPLGAIVPLNVGVGLPGNRQLAATFNLTTTLSWFIVSFAATSIVALRCVRNIHRYGVTGFTRPNWWYECGRLNLILTLSSLIACFALIDAAAEIKVFRSCRLRQSSGQQ